MESINIARIDHGEMEPESLAAALLGSPVVTRRTAGGGCINEAYALIAADGRGLFVKRNQRARASMFLAEAAGLAALRAAEVPRVPRPFALCRHGSYAYLLMEHVQTSTPTGNFQARLGQQLAHLHRTARNPRAGFEADNYIGSTPQPNAWDEDWFRFLGEKRLMYQVRLARRNGLLDAAAERAAARLAARLGELLPPLDAGGASLLHGDLWSGNYLCDEFGAPVLIDPAVYYGHCEADLAMTALFGGFTEEFYAAYEQSNHLEPGYRARFAIYNLYHLLNHLNIFGTSYLSGVLSTLRRFAPG